MELAYRLVLYILIANVGYMILSLSNKGFRASLGYLLQLTGVLVLMVGMIGWGSSGPVAVIISLLCIFFLVVVPLILQRRIEALIAEQRFTEMEPLARWKAAIAWSSLNRHLYRISQAVGSMNHAPAQAESEIQKLLGQGEPYDGMTRMFLVMIHFHMREFDRLVNDLMVPGKPFSEFTFEELLYLVRGFLETGRNEEAVAAQIALENLSDEANPDQINNLLVSRLIFFAFLGWEDDYQQLLKVRSAYLETLPEILRDFWAGIAKINTGLVAEGRTQIEHLFSKEQEIPEHWLFYMRQRLDNLIENQLLHVEKTIPKLMQLRLAHRDYFVQVIHGRNVEAPVEILQTATNRLSWILIGVFILLMFLGNSSDLIDLVSFGANSGFLVEQGEYFRLMSGLFIHMGWVHLFMNVMGLKYLGPSVETLTKWPLFLSIFFISGLFGSLATVYSQSGLSVGASGAVLGLLSASIVLELGKAAPKSFSYRSQIPTLLFILVLNGLIGFVEKGIDNSAHIGGLVGGVATGLIALLALRVSKLFKPISVFMLLLVCIMLLASAFQFSMKASVSFYPRNVRAFTPSSRKDWPIKFDVPQGWQLEERKQDGRRSLVIKGLLHEQLDFSFFQSEKSFQTVLQNHFNARTRDFTDMGDSKLRSTIEPKLVSFGENQFYFMKWRLQISDTPMVERDYFLFYKDGFLLVQSVFPTDRDDYYDNLVERVLASVKISVSE